MTAKSILKSCSPPPWIRKLLEIWLALFYLRSIWRMADAISNTSLAPVNYSTQLKISADCPEKSGMIDAFVGGLATYTISSNCSNSMPACLPRKLFCSKDDFFSNCFIPSLCTLGSSQSSVSCRRGMAGPSRLIEHYRYH